MVAKLAKTDRLIGREGKHNQAPPDAWGKPVVIVIPRYPQHWLDDIRDFILN